MKLSDDEIKNLYIGALLHDIGKIGISEAIINKPDRLTNEEFQEIKTHPSRGAMIIEPAKFLKEKVPLIKYHHERFDGKGYPEGLKGEEIPFGGRILAVSDVFDAITSKRHYRDKMPIQNVIDILKDGKNKHFDGKLVDAFLSIPVDKIIRIFLTENHNEFKDEDAKILNKYNLNDIYAFIIDENSDKKNIAELFNYYYAGNRED